MNAQYFRIVPGKNIGLVFRQFPDGLVAIQVPRRIIDDGRGAIVPQVVVGMHRIRGDHRRSGCRRHFRDLHPLGMAAHLVHLDSRQNLLAAIGEAHPAIVIEPHQFHHVVHLHGCAEMLIADIFPRPEGHLVFLEVIGGVGEEAVISRMIPVHMAEDDVFHLGRIDSNCFQLLGGMPKPLPAALFAQFLGEPAIDDGGGLSVGDGPQVVGQIQQCGIVDIPQLQLPVHGIPARVLQSIDLIRIHCVPVALAGSAALDEHRKSTIQGNRGAGQEIRGRAGQIHRQALEIVNIPPPSGGRVLEHLVVQSIDLGAGFLR